LTLDGHLIPRVSLSASSTALCRHSFAPPCGPCKNEEFVLICRVAFYFDRSSRPHRHHNAPCGSGRTCKTLISFLHNWVLWRRPCVSEDGQLVTCGLLGSRPIPLHQADAICFAMLTLSNSSPSSFCLSLRLYLLAILVTLHWACVWFPCP
jgi:hypothetical protein